MMIKEKKVTFGVVPMLWEAKAAVIKNEDEPVENDARLGFDFNK